MTDAQMHAEILTYSRQRGLFGGLDISWRSGNRRQGLQSRAVRFSDQQQRIVEQ